MAWSPYAFVFLLKFTSYNQIEKSLGRSPSILAKSSMILSTIYWIIFANKTQNSSQEKMRSFYGSSHSSRNVPTIVKRSSISRFKRTLVIENTSLYETSL